MAPTEGELLWFLGVLLVSWAAERIYRRMEEAMTDPQPRTAYLYTALGHEVIDNALDEITVCFLGGLRCWLIVENGQTYMAGAYREMREDEECRLDESLS